MDLPAAGGARGLKFEISDSLLNSAFCASFHDRRQFPWHCRVHVPLSLCFMPRPCKVKPRPSPGLVWPAGTFSATAPAGGRIFVVVRLLPPMVPAEIEVQVRAMPAIERVLGHLDAEIQVAVVPSLCASPPGTRSVSPSADILRRECVPSRGAAHGGCPPFGSHSKPPTSRGRLPAVPARNEMRMMASKSGCGPRAHPRAALAAEAAEAVGEEAGQAHVAQRTLAFREMLAPIPVVAGVWPGARGF